MYSLPILRFIIAAYKSHLFIYFGSLGHTQWYPVATHGAVPRFIPEQHPVDHMVSGINPGCAACKAFAPTLYYPLALRILYLGISRLNKWF